MKLFFNTNGTKGRITEEAKAFLKYVGGIPSEDPYVKELQLKVETAKRDEKWRLEYMRLLERDNENIAKGFQQGLEQGKAEGATEEKLRIVYSMLQDNDMSENRIVSLTGISLEELQEMKRSFKKGSCKN